MARFTLLREGMKNNGKDKKKSGFFNHIYNINFLYGTFFCTCNKFI